MAPSLNACVCINSTYLHRGQFHQHFTSSFCANFLLPKNYKPKPKVQKICLTDFGTEKAAHKMLVKLTHLLFDCLSRKYEYLFLCSILSLNCFLMHEKMSPRIFKHNHLFYKIIFKNYTEAVGLMMVLQLQCVSQNCAQN